MLPSSESDCFAGHRYVSDALEELLAAGETRRAVRAYCTGLLEGLPDALRNQLEHAAGYIGGKCMGYPAVWYLEKLLSPEGVAVEEILRRCHTALCISLTTSIVDDLGDRDEAIDPNAVAYLYILIAHVAFDGARAIGHDLDTRNLLYRALDVCLNPRAENTPAAIVRRGDRIGGFYRMIATEALAGLWPQDRAAIAIDAIGKFGEACAHIDDWLDAERDLEQGTAGNTVLMLLTERLGRTPSARDLLEHRAELSIALETLLWEKLASSRSLLRLDSLLGITEFSRSAR